MNPKVDLYLSKVKKWHAEIDTLRAIVRACPLTEKLKWGHPCYTVDGANVVLIHGFKEYCALLFFKGALLKDDKNILITQTENVQAARQIRFTSLADITKIAPVLTSYIDEAIAVEKAGLKVPFKKTAEFTVPEEFQQRLDAMPALKKAFDALTPGRQRAYILYFSDAKQAKTRESRIDKCMPQILDGKGLKE
jgi:uncharacterized protein YdeI (YjbR/CyaY-like superfamily)